MTLLVIAYEIYIINSYLNSHFNSHILIHFSLQGLILSNNGISSICFPDVGFGK